MTSRARTTTRFTVALALGLPLLTAQQCGPGGQVSGDGLWSHRPNMQVGSTTASPYSGYAADLAALDQLLAQAPLEGTGQGGIDVTLPMPDGSFLTVQVLRSPVLSPALEAQHPDLRTYAASSADDPTASGRLDLTRSGFHGMLTSAEGTVFVEPADGDATRYVSYWQRDTAHEAVECDGDHSTVPLAFPSATGGGGFPSANPSGDVLRTYRMAVSTNGEYTQLFGSLDCPSPVTAACAETAAIARVLTSVNRVNAIFEREVSVRLELTAVNVYHDPAMDPFTEMVPGVDSCTLAAQNGPALDAVVGPSNFDIGHAFLYTPLRRNPGCGSLASVCQVTKGRGATGGSTPYGDIFDVFVLAHELGHQFGAAHTFSGDERACAIPFQHSFGSDYEPGSGSTIMSYAGGCGSQNVVGRTDFDAFDYFHTHSYNQIVFIRDHPFLGGSCGAATATGNTPPTVDAGADCTIPRSTPFTLVATGYDPDGGPLTYTWEQYDFAGQVGFPDPFLPGSPLFRSLPPGQDPTRTIPRFEDLLTSVASIPPGQPGSGWEVLPEIDRDLNFRVTVRDGLGGVDYASRIVHVAGDPFSVVQPASGDVLECGQPAFVTWELGGGAFAQAVDVSLSSDGGATFLPLALGTANDGSEGVVVPAASVGASARVLVEPANECFFALSEAFSVVDTTPPTLLLSASAAPGTGDPGTAVIDVAPDAADGCELDAAVRLVSATSADAGAAILDVSNDEKRLAVAVPEAGAVYTLVYEASDSSGNSATASLDLAVFRSE
jgi:hypothetical protein